MQNHEFVIHLLREVHVPRDQFGTGSHNQYFHSARGQLNKEVT